MSGANIIDLLGSLEPNQITLAEDELEDIYEDPDKLRIYKVGYDESAVIPRTLDGNTSNRTNRYYYPFALKIFAAEGSPDHKKLEGFKDRIFTENTVKGVPNVYVKELLKSGDSKKYKKLLDRINYLRKLTLVFRLIHHHDVIERINTNIDGRALELTGPQIRLFNSDKLAAANKKALNEILPVLSAYLKKKGELAATTLDSRIHQAILSLINSGTYYEEIGALDGASLYTIPYEEIYPEVKEYIDGEDLQEGNGFISQTLIR